jgi:hypothetical protein
MLSCDQDTESGEADEGGGGGAPVLAARACLVSERARVADSALTRGAGRGGRRRWRRRRLRQSRAAERDGVREERTEALRGTTRQCRRSATAEQAAPCRGER